MADSDAVTFDALPIPVEVVNHTDWWQPYVPPLVGLVGSLIVAAAAFYGVAKSNRTNQSAINAADRREWDKWRRETLLKLCTDALTRALVVEEIYGAGLRPGMRDYDFQPAYIEYQQFRPIVHSLQMLGYVDLADRCMQMLGTAADIYPHALQLRFAMNTYEDECEKVPSDSPNRNQELDRLRTQLMGEKETAYFGAKMAFLKAQGELTIRASLELDPIPLTKKQILELMRQHTDRDH